jgi:hypothetical protein
MNQLSFFEDIDEKAMRRLVVKELKNYKVLCVRMKNQEEQAPLSSRQDLKSATKQSEFYMYMDPGYLISFEIFDDYKSVYICARQI